MRAARNAMMKVSCNHHIIVGTTTGRHVVRDTIGAMNSSTCITRRVNTSSISGTFSDGKGNGADSSLPLHEALIPKCYGRDDDERKRNVPEKSTIVRQLALPPPRANRLVENFHWSSSRSFIRDQSRINANQSHHQICQSRAFGLSSRAERAPQVAILALGSVALTAKAGQYAVQAYDEWSKNRPADPPPPAESEAGSAEGADHTAKSSGSSEGETKKDAASGDRENFFQKYFNVGVGSKYYEGGFEDKMTKREAALILGVRESSTPKRIKEAHRKLLILNHPDTGGSTFLSGKLNEAKDLLLKGVRRN